MAERIAPHERKYRSLVIAVAFAAFIAGFALAFVTVARGFRRPCADADVVLDATPGASDSRDDQAPDLLNELGEQFVAAIRDGDIVEHSQCWVSYRRFVAIVNATRASVPLDADELSEMKAAFEERNKHVLHSFAAITEAVSRSGELSELRLASIDGTYVEQDGCPMFALVVIELCLGDATFEVESGWAVEDNGSWSFLDHFVEVTLGPKAVKLPDRTRATSLRADGRGPFGKRLRAQTPRATDKMNLHDTGIAIAVWQEDHDGRTPPNLKALVDAGHIEDADILVSPIDTEPPVIHGLKCSYVYIGELPANVAPDLPLCYTRKGMWVGERNMLFADRAILSVREETLAGPGPRGATMQESYEQVVAKLGAAATEERKAELRKFFGIEEPAPTRQLDVDPPVDAPAE